MKKHKFIFLILSCSYLLNGQEILRLPEAIGIAIKNNFAIQISLNESAISKNNVSKGNAGMLPELTFNAGTSFSGNNTEQEFVTGNKVDQKGAQSDNINTGLALNWIVFDGMKMFISYDKLKEINRMSNIATKQQIENTVFEVCAAYYNLVKHQQSLKLNEQLISIYEERLKVSKVKWEIGKSAKTDYLQAQFDLNLQKSARIKLISTYNELKINLNRQLSRAPEIEFEVIDEIEVNKFLSLDELKNSSLKLNSTLLLNQSNILISQFRLKEFESERFPDISLNANYNFSRTKNQAGFLLFSQNLGWNAGLTARWTIFNGYNIDRNIKNARIELNNASIQLEYAKHLIQSDLHISFIKYQAALNILQLNEDNALLAKENLDILLESFQLGSANTLELKEAQRNFEDANTILFQTRYDAKIAETELLRLKGELVK